MDIDDLKARAKKLQKDADGLNEMLRVLREAIVRDEAITQCAKIAGEYNDHAAEEINKLRVSGTAH